VGSESGKNLQSSYQNHRYGWAVFFVVVYSSIVYTVAYQSVPPMIPVILEEFSITDLQAGLTMSIVAIPGLLLGLPSGWLLSRHSAKKIGVSALICMAVASVVTAFSNTFELMLFGRLILGFGGILMSITSLAIISQWLRDKDLGKAIGLMGAISPIVLTITFPTVSIAVLNFGWRFPFYVSSLLAVTAAVIFWIVIKDRPFSEDKKIKTGLQDFANLELWKLGLVCFCIQCSILSFSTWAPTLFTEFKHIPSVQASSLVGLFSLPKIILFPFFGYLSDRMGKRRPFIILSPLLMTIAFVTFALGSDLTIIGSVIFLSVAVAIGAAASNAAAPQIVGQKKAGIGFGALSVFGSIAGVLSAPLIGFLIDITGSFIVALMGMVSFSVAAVFLALVLKLN
jgi:MFS family permease